MQEVVHQETMVAIMRYHEFVLDVGMPRFY